MPDLEGMYGYAGYAEWAQAVAAEAVPSFKDPRVTYRCNACGDLYGSAPEDDVRCWACGSDDDLTRGVIIPGAINPSRFITDECADQEPFMESIAREAAGLRGELVAV